MDVSYQNGVDQSQLSFLRSVMLASHLMIGNQDIDQTNQNGEIQGSNLDHENTSENAMMNLAQISAYEDSQN